MDTRMSSRWDAAIGRPLDAIETPFLALDLDRFEANARAISGELEARGVAWRPHAKGHKSPELARRQVALGAVGVTVAKLGEADVMADGGIERILVVTEPGTPLKAAHAARLQRSAEVIVPVDHRVQVDWLAAAARAHDVTIPVVVELDIGMRRCGVAPGSAALELGRVIAKARGLELRGLFAYEGHLLRTWPAEEKDRVIRAAIGELVETAEVLRAAGLPVGYVTCGGTGSYRISVTVPGITEIQAGGGCFMDRMYAEACHVPDLEPAMTGWATVVSRPGPDRAVTDGGWKTFSADRGNPSPLGLAGLSVRYLSAEHGVLDVAAGSSGPSIGDRIEFVLGYHDSTVVLHDVIYGSRGGVVEAIFPVAARGRLS